MNILFKVSEQTFWQLLSKFVTSLSALFILSLVSRNFGESATGVFTLSLAYLSFFYLAVDFGINPHVISSFLKDGASLSWQKLLGLRVLLGLMLPLVASGLVLIWPGESAVFKQSVIFGSLAVFGFGIFTTTSALFQAKLRYDLYVIGTVAGSAVTAGIIYLFSKQDTEVPLLMLGFVAGWLVNALVSLMFVKRYVSISPVFDFLYAKRIIKEVWPISAALIINVLYFRLDAFMLSAIKTFAEVGVYNLSYQIFQAALVVPTFIMNSFYPLMLRDFNEYKKRFISRLKTALFLMLGISLIGVALTFLLSPFIISLISGGSGFEGASLVLQLLSLSFPAFFVTSIFMWTLITYKRYKTLTVIYLIGLMVNALLNLVFIPRYSFLGAAATTVASEYFILIMQAVVLYRLLSKHN